MQGMQKGGQKWNTKYYMYDRTRGRQRTEILTRRKRRINITNTKEYRTRGMNKLKKKVKRDENR